MSLNSLAEHLQNLNPEQLAAVKHTTGPILVLAGAGSGKTRVLTRRVSHLILEHNVPPSKILAVTFTNKAAKEMKERLTALLENRARYLWVSTFHSTSLRILRKHAHLLGYKQDFSIYDEQDSKTLLKNVLAELNIDDKKHPIPSFKKAIEKAKNNLIAPDQFSKQAHSYEQNLKASVYERYQAYLYSANAMDFGDLIYNLVVVFKKFPEVLEQYQNTFEYLLVDEFQDTNEVQYELLRMLTRKHRNLFVVGDDDQSIYAFRGANVTNILNFEKDYPESKVVKLEQNYRSTANILTVSNAIIRQNSNRKEKALWTEQNAGDLISTFVAQDEIEEALFIGNTILNKIHQGYNYKDCTIFYRVNAQSRALEETFLDLNIPYRIFGGLKFYDRKEIKDILAYLKMILNPDDNQAFLRTVNTPTRGIGNKALSGIIEIANSTNTSLYEAAKKVGEGNKHVVNYISLIQSLQKEAECLSLSSLIEKAIESTGYGPKLRTMKDISAQSRLENLDELRGIGLTMELDGDELDVLRSFLDRTALTASDEKVKDGEKADDNQVSLMTLHLAKGLEFPIVFLTGLEEGLIPHSRSIPDPKQVEEECRLCYVGMTRAMKELYLTRARYRTLFSKEYFESGGGYRKASRFVLDLPAKFLTNNGGDFLNNEPNTYNSTFDDDDFDLEPVKVTYDAKKPANVFSDIKNFFGTGDQLEKASKK